MFVSSNKNSIKESVQLDSEKVTGLNPCWTEAFVCGVVLLV